MFKHNTLAKSVRLAMALSVASVSFNSSIAMAAEDTDEEAKGTERITVVGSRIRTDEFANETPIDIITVADAEKAGVQTLGELLRTSTAAAGSSQITAALSVGFVTDGGTGAETVSLRGLGASRTLILLNGRRAGPAGTRGAVSAFDLNSIPLSAVERVEILKDGASALYGSDAVAGVINIITRKGDSKSINVDISQPFESGGEDKRINISYGEEFSEGSFRVTADFRQISMLQRGDRDFLNCSERLQFREDGTRADPIDPRTGSYHCSETGYGLWLYGQLRDTYGRTVYGAYDYDGFFAANGYESFNDRSDETGFTTPEGWYPVAYTDNPDSRGWWNTQNPFLDRETLVPETTNASLYFTGELNLTDDIVSYGEFIHSRRVTKADGYRQFWTSFFVAPDPATNGFDGIGVIDPTAITDHNSDKITVDYTRAVIGATGDIGFWTWDLSYQHSYNDGEYQGDLIFADSIAMSSGHAIDGTTCSGEVTPISGRTCVDIPWHDPYFIRGDISPEARNFLFGSDTGRTTYKQQTLEGYVTGDVLELPAGEVGAAIGFQFQRDEINDVPGEQTLAGNIWGSSSSGITAGDQFSKAVYAEFLIPVLEDMPFAEKLDLTASARWTDVDTYGSDSTFKLGANWQIVEGFNVRASRGTSFRSPALFELYLADQSGFRDQRTIDPCLDYQANFDAGSLSQTVYDNCRADGIPSNYVSSVSSATVITSGGAGRLKAETSVAEGIGFVFTSPEQTYALSIDYFKVNISDEVYSLSGQQITSRCYASQDFANEPLCNLFERRDGTNDDYGIELVNSGYVNIANQVARGVDYQFTYNEDFDFGSIRFAIEHTMQIERVRQIFDDSIYNNLIGENGNPKHTGVARLTYSKDDYSITWTANYFDSTNDYEYASSETNTTVVFGETLTFIDETPWTTYHTVSGSFKYEDFDFIVGVANVFDEEPPRISSSGSEVGNAARYSQYDFIGRRAFANIRYNF